MKYIQAKDIPDLKETDVMSAREWFKSVMAVGVSPGLHADDTIEADYEMPSKKALSKEAALKLDGARLRLFSASKSWVDPDFIYCLFGQGRFDIEKRYPGFIMDCSIISASRTGYVSPPGQEAPTVLAEERGEFFAIQFTPVGKLSEATKITVVPTEGVEFGGSEYIDYSDMTLLTEEAVTVESLKEIDGAIEALLNRELDGPRF